MASLYDIPLVTIDGRDTRLNEYAGKVLLIVNVASKCGLTPQYEGLEALYREKKDQGLVVLGFPANNFKEQEPGTDAEIQTFCQTQYDVSFPLFSKLSVAGDDQHPLYQALTAALPEAQGSAPFRERLEGMGIATLPAPNVLWNFEKFLIGKQGDVVARFGPNIAADDAALRAAIDGALAH
ncbi:glutathione peroxidase [Isoalcanivorax beigongshangi]|uniref:Glutathione peroxidase n=1 Tax=Isoalcanivorax beigongshangi TaxID=3238810 RepID=A0ABV4AKC9_9GAMM